MVHASACLIPKGRTRLPSATVDDGRTYRRAAERFQCSPATAKKWADCYRDCGVAVMTDRSSQPRRSPARTASPTTCVYPALWSKRCCVATGFRCCAI